MVESKLTAARRARDLSLYSLASALGMTPERWQAIEQGLIIPPAKTCRRIFAVLGVSPDDDDADVLQPASAGRR